MSKINKTASKSLECAKGIEQRNKIVSRSKKKIFWVLFFALMVNFGILAFLKYFNFLADNLNIVLSKFSINPQVKKLNLFLPLGISFYTFQSAGYLLDVYRKKYDPERNLAKFALFVSFFPQIVQGPISRYDQLAHQLCKEHKVNYNQIKFGAHLILWGLFKKMVIADRAAIIVNQVFGNYIDYSGIQIFIAAILFTIQIYADFSGGIDIAIGVAQTLGIKLTNNFRRPFFSKNISEFWQRWHITLGAWMRNYIFYPLCLSKSFSKLGKYCRKLLGNTIGKTIPISLATILVFLIIGIWHGAQWKFIAYGLINGVFIAMGMLLEPLFKKIRHASDLNSNHRLWRISQMIRTFLFFTCARYFIRATSFNDAINLLSATIKDFKIHELLTASTYKLGLNLPNLFILLISLMVLFTIELLQEKGYNIRILVSQQKIALRWSIYYLAIIWILVFGIYGSNYHASDFIYMGY
jgi:alginate O-acetyltransferase complex protein AlgI